MLQYRVCNELGIVTSCMCVLCDFTRLMLSVMYACCFCDIGSCMNRTKPALAAAVIGGFLRPWYAGWDPN